MHRTVASFADPIEAHIVCGRLQAEGIDAHVADGHTALANWEWRLLIGGVRIRVPEADHERARRIIAEVDGGGYTLAPESTDAPESDADADVSGTPQAQGGDHETWSSRLAYVAAFIFGLPLPWTRRARVARPASSRSDGDDSGRDDSGRDDNSRDGSSGTLQL